MSNDDVSDVITMKDLIGDMSHLTISSGYIKVRNLNIKYWKYYNPNEPLGPRDPIVALHGGPSACHNYILPLQLLAHYGYPVYFYDQAGCGESRNGVEDPRDGKHDFLLTVDYYVEELKQIISQLKLHSYFVYGSSWGTSLAQEFAVLQPCGLRGLILDGAFSDSKTYMQGQWSELISQLPTFTQAYLRKLTEEKNFDSKAYQILDHYLEAQFTCRQLPHPKCYLDSDLGTNKTIYRLMQGYSEFCVGGVLENWSIVDRLHRVEVPALVVRGEYDTMTETTSQQVVENLKYSWPLLRIPRAGHCKLCDEPKLCCDEFLKFLLIVDKASSS